MAQEAAPQDSADRVLRDFQDSQTAQLKAAQLQQEAEQAHDRAILARVTQRGGENAAQDEVKVIAARESGGMFGEINAKIYEGDVRRDEMLHSAGKAIGAAADSVETTAKAALNTVVDKTESFWEAAAGAVKGVKDTIVNGAEVVKDTVTAGMDSVASGFKNTLAAQGIAAQQEAEANTAALHAISQGARDVKDSTLDGVIAALQGMRSVAENHQGAPARPTATPVVMAEARDGQQL